MKKNIFKSVASLALSLALTFSATAIFSKYTASAADATNSKTFDFDSVNSFSNGTKNSSFNVCDSVHYGESGKSLKFNFTGNTTNSHSANVHRTLLTTNGNSGGAYDVIWDKTYKVTFQYRTEGTAPYGPCRLGIYTSVANFSTATNTTYQIIEKPLYFETTGTSDWKEYTTRFTATQKDNTKINSTKLGLGIVFPAGNYSSSNYSIYIDDVIIEEDTVGSSVTVPENTFDFDNTVLDRVSAGDTTNSSFTISNDADLKDNGGSSLKVYREANTKDGDLHKALLTKADRLTGDKFDVEWNKTYKVTLWYKTVGNAPQGMDAWKLGLYTCAPGTNALSGPEQMLDAPIWFRKTATSGWSKAETTFTAAYSVDADKDKTSLGLIVNFPAFSDNNGENAYAVYIDDVTVEEITPETPNDTTKTFDFNGFDSYSDGYANSGLKYTAPEDLHIADSGKSLMVYRDKIEVPGYHRALLTTDGKSTGEKYSVEWGKTYKVTLWYKTVGNFGGETPWSLGLFTGLNTGFINTTAQQTMSEQLEFPTEATDWTKFETTFTATESKADRRDNTYLGIGVNFPVFSDNEKYKVYIDDVTVSEIRDNGDVNGDGKVDTDDFNTLRQELLNNNTASANKCDVNGDGSVDIRDLVALDEILKNK